MPPGLDRLQHIVVLMMENRSFDHMLGSLKAVNPKIDGYVDGDAFTNPDANGNPVKPQPQAAYQAQLQPDPDHHFPAVDLQLYGKGTDPKDVTREPNNQGFVLSYYHQQQDLKHSQMILYYFPKEKLPVLNTLALEFAVYNRWFASIPGPTICNRAFAHYGTSFGRVDLNPIYPPESIKSVYTRLITANPKRTAKIYYYDKTSSTMEVANLLQNEPELFGTYSQFLDDCDKGNLPDYSFIEPNYNDHQGDSGEEVANDQHPDHHVQQGEVFIASVYQAIKNNPELWESTALLITYDEHGGIFDHVPPPRCVKDKFKADSNATGTGAEFLFDRLGVRVPTILVSPWIPKGTVVNRVFDHASIPATVTKFFLGTYAGDLSPRETSADIFIEPQGANVDPDRNVLSEDTMRTDCPDFDA
ncbi:MAG TPA: alkaline phosphatase family protein [Candidatus Sulfotelmatobacter sp.]|nr:alkaline phosphatase family protein [Candidatus Sulfotelmatobacter sp.]